MKDVTMMEIKRILETGDEGSVPRNLIDRVILESQLAAHEDRQAIVKSSKEDRREIIEYIKRLERINRARLDAQEGRIKVIEEIQEKDPSVLSLYRKRAKRMTVILLSPFLLPLFFHTGEIKTAFPSIVKFIQLFMF